MVGGEADDRILGDARRFQRVHQIGQGVFQLQIGRHVRLHLRRGVGVRRLRLGTVFRRHGVSPAVAAVTADGHVVGVERRAVLDVAVDILTDGVLQHLQIGVRPRAVLRELKPAALPVVVVAQIGVGAVAVVVVVDVVVVGGGGIAQGAELVAQREGHTVAPRGVEADVAVHPRGQQAGHHGELAAGGGLPPAGLVEVVADEALVGQAVEGGGQLLTDEPRGERLGGEEDQVLALEQTGIAVLFGGGQAAEVPGHFGDRPVGGVLRQRGEVDVHGVVAVGHRRGGGGVLLRRRGQQLRAGLTEQGVGRLQPEGGVEPEVGNAGIGVEVIGVGVAIRAPAGQRGGGAPQQQGEGEQEKQGAFAGGAGGDNAAAQDDAEHQRQERQEDKGQARQHHLGDGGAEAGDHMVGHAGDEAEEEVGAEVAAAAVLHAEEHRPEGDDGERECRCQPAAAEQVEEKAPEQPGGQGEKHHQHQSRVEEKALAVEGAEKELVV